MQERSRTAAIALTALGGIVATCFLFYPGVMSPDSLGMYGEAISGTITGDSKTPMIKVLWWLILSAAPHPFALLLVQTVAFWTGLALVVSACRLGARTAAVTLLAIGFWPPVFGLLGMLWADVQMVAMLTLSVGVALFAASRRSRAGLTIAMILLACAFSIRANAAVAIAPLAAWLVLLWPRKKPALRGITLLVRALLILVVMAGATRLFDRTVVTSRAGGGKRALQFSMLHDLAGMASATGDLRLPAYIYRSIPSINLDVIRSAYDPADVNLLIYNRAWDSSAFVTEDPREFDELVTVWSGAVRAHPGAYFKRRVDAIAAGFQLRGVHYPFHTGIDPNNLGLVFGEMPGYRPTVDWLNATKGVFFRGWIFALVALAVVWAGIRRRRWSAVAVASSGLFYVAPYVVISTGADFRYIWWLVVSALLSIPLLLFSGERDGTDETARA